MIGIYSRSWKKWLLCEKQRHCRVVRSTIAADDWCLKCWIYWNLCHIGNIMSFIQHRLDQHPISIHECTNNESLYRNAQSTTMVEERGLPIDLATIKEMLLQMLSTNRVMCFFTNLDCLDFSCVIWQESLSKLINECTKWPKVRHKIFVGCTDEVLSFYSKWVLRFYFEFKDSIFYFVSLCYSRFFQKRGAMVRTHPHANWFGHRIDHMRKLV